MDPAEVAAAFDELYRAGKVLGFGVSNFTPSHLAMLASHVEQPLVTNQVEVSALHLEPFVDGTLDQALERRMRPMAWSPLGGGRLFTGEGEQEGRVRGALEQLARQRETSVDTLAYALPAAPPLPDAPDHGLRPPAADRRRGAGHRAGALPGGVVRPLARLHRGSPALSWHRENFDRDRSLPACLPLGRT